MISIVTTCKPFTGHNGIIQRNALRSWRAYIPDAEIIIGGSEAEEIANEINATVIADIKRSEYGTPILPFLLEILETVAKGEIRAYVNSDIILLPDWYLAVMHCANKFDGQFFAVGKRWDMQLSEELVFTDITESTLRTYASSIHGPFGKDYFVGRPGLWEINIPPLLVGRMYWDNWMLDSALIRGIPTIDLTLATLVIHQNHDYSHISGNVEYGPEAQVNRAIYHSANATDNTSYYMCENGEIVKR